MSAYPIEFESDYVEQRSRLTTFFRFFMIIPHSLVAIAYGIALFFTLLIAWFALVFTARYPQGLYKFNAGVLRWFTQVYGYMFLLNDRFPPFGLDAVDYPVRVLVGPPQTEYSRLKVFFRLFLIIPWAIVIGIYSYITGFAAFVSWFAIVITGKQPELLQRGVNFFLGPNTKFTGFAFLLTDAWPPFEPDTRLEPRAVGAGLAAPELPTAPA